MSIFKRYSQAHSIAACLFDVESLVDLTATTPIIRITPAIPYMGMILIAGISKMPDGSLHWHVIINFGTQIEARSAIEFEDLPLSIIGNCLNLLMCSVGIKPIQCDDKDRVAMLDTLDEVIDGLGYVRNKIEQFLPLSKEDWQMASVPLRNAMSKFVDYNLQSSIASSLYPQK